MQLISTAGDLYREIKRRGLELRGGDGRDDALYSELIGNLKMPSKFKNLQEFLDKDSISIETFVEAFLTLVAPFAQMYQYIYSSMRKYGGRKASESIRMIFDFENFKMDFDLENFKEEIRIIQKATIRKKYQLWNQDALRLLFEYIRKLTSNVPISGQHFWKDYDYYRVGKPFQIPPVPLVSTKLHEQVSSIREIFTSIIDTLVELENVPKTNDPRAEKIAILRETTDDRDDINLHDEHEIVTIRGMGYLLTDLMPGFRELLSKMNDPNYEKNAGKDRIQNAIDYFDEKITPQLKQTARNVEANVELLFEILNLPMWKYRWFVYEVWCSLQAVDALESYNSCLSIVDDKLTIDQGKRWSELAQFESNVGDGKLFCQAYVETQKVFGRKAIMPDLVISTDLSHSTPNPEIKILIEFKQRVSYSHSQLLNLINDYDKGSPQSVLNLFVNYDLFPNVPDKDIATQQKSILLSNMNPKFPEQIKKYKRLIVDSLEKSQIYPLAPQIDAILLDVSSSMGSEYHKNDSYHILEEIINEVVGVKIFYFNDDLIDPNAISPEHLTSFSRIQSMIRGGTSLEKTLRTLRQKFPEVNKVLLVTDGGYGTSVLKNNYEIIETTPSNLRSTWKHLREAK
jgi:hypothetical protein